MPCPKQEELNTLYEKHYNFGSERNTRYTLLRSKFLNSKAYRLWVLLDGDISFHLNKGSGRLLDVGCNEGRSLEFFRFNGFEAEGLELNRNAAATARTKGFVIHNTSLENFATENRYDVIVLSNVLEHALLPIEMLRNIYSLLNPGGQVWISCPNSKSWLRNVLGKYWINWHVPFHVTHFSSGTLNDVLFNVGFGNVKTKNETPALWVAHSFISRAFAKRGIQTHQLRSAPLVASLILVIRALLFPILWFGNLIGRGDCLVVTACKK